MTVSYVARALRWRVLLSAQSSPSISMTFWITCIGYLGNYILPARAGEIIRVFYMGERAKISKSYVLATALTERMVDAAFLALVILSLLPFLDFVPQEITDASVIIFVFIGIAIVGLIIVLRFSPRIINLLEQLPIPFLRDQTKSIVEKFLEGFQPLSNTQTSIKFISITLLIWILDVITGLLVGVAFSMWMTPTQMLLLLATLGLSSAIPSTPGYIGVYQFVAVTVMEPFGYLPEQSLTFILGFQAVVYVLVLLWGGIGLWTLNISLLRTPDVEVQHNKESTS